MAWELERILRGDDAEDLLRSALHSSGLPLDAWNLERIYSRPAGTGLETSARYRVMAAGQPVILVASTRRLSSRQRHQLGAVRCDAPAGTVHIWAHPRDPELPGLTVAEDRDQLADRISQARGTPVEVIGSEMLVLRPLRRAVYRVVLRDRDTGAGTTGEETAYVKIVRPSKLPELLKRHAACLLAPPVTDLGEGLTLMTAAEGISLLHLLHQRDRAPAGPEVDPKVVISATESLDPSAVRLPARTPVSRRVATILPAAASRGADTQRLDHLHHIMQAQLTPEDTPAVPVHGDFHPSNIFLDPDGQRVSALIDTDTVGPGYRADDLATLYAHLTVLPSFDAVGYARVPALLDRLWELTSDLPECSDLAIRTAAAVVSLIPGMRTDEQVEYCLDSAESLVKSGMPPHQSPEKTENHTASETSM